MTTTMTYACAKKQRVLVFVFRWMCSGIVKPDFMQNQDSTWGFLYRKRWMVRTCADSTCKVKCSMTLIVTPTSIANIYSYAKKSNGAGRTSSKIMRVRLCDHDDMTSICVAKATGASCTSRRSKSNFVMGMLFGEEANKRPVRIPMSVLGLMRIISHSYWL